MVQYGYNYPVLDKGFVGLADSMGSDVDITDAARISYKGKAPVSSDKRLLRRLYRDEHMSPFEMVEIKLIVKAPLFVVAQWDRHRTQSKNQISGRYTKLTEDLYVPSAWRLQHKTNRQGSEGEHASQEEIFRRYDEVTTLARQAYDWLTAEDIANEMARMVLPVTQYTEFIVKANLRNWLHFLKLRMDPHAQWEIREYANTIAFIIQELCPWAYESFIDYDLAAVKFSRMEIGLVRQLLHDRLSTVDPVSSYGGHELLQVMTKNEKQDFVAKLCPQTSEFTYRRLCQMFGIEE